MITGINECLMDDMTERLIMPVCMAAQGATFVVESRNKIALIRADDIVLMPQLFPCMPTCGWHLSEIGMLSGMIIISLMVV